MQKAIVTNKKIVNSKLENINRVYIGNDNCQELFDAIKIIDLFSFYNKKINITLLLPFFTDTNFCKLEKTIKSVYQKVNLKTFEVVFNDWGTFYYLRKYYPKIHLVLGRLLTKQKKDPRIDVILNNKQQKFRILKLKDGITKVLNTKETPSSLFDIYSRSSVESKEFFKFLANNSVNRIEIDNITRNIKVETNKNIKVSLYYPYMLLTLTRYCGAIYGNKDTVCSKNCSKKALSLDNNLFIKGNSLYYKNVTLPQQKQLKLNNIDRIIYLDIQ